MSPVRWCAVGSALVGLAAGGGCSSGEPPGPPPKQAKWSSRKVTGTVTYQGRPVPYGYVVFYSPGTHRLTPTGVTMPPAAVGVIGPGGRYEINAPPVGPVRVCVATDPDADPNTLLGPVTPGLKHGPGGPPQPQDPNRPPDLPPEGPAGAFPTLPLDKNGKPFNPETERLSAEEKKALREVHERYGILDRSALSLVVADGSTDQTFNIVLPLEAAKK
jgi:hypothetical protein